MCTKEKHDISMMKYDVRYTTRDRKVHDVIRVTAETWVDKARE